MAGDGGDRDRGCDADKDQERRHQESAADAEHAGHETNRRAHRQDEENIDRYIGDRKVQLHARLLRSSALRQAEPAHGIVSDRALCGNVKSGCVEKGFSGNADQLPRPCITEIVRRRD